MDARTRAYLERCRNLEPPPGVHVSDAEERRLRKARRHDIEIGVGRGIVRGLILIAVIVVAFMVLFAIVTILIRPF